MVERRQDGVADARGVALIAGDWAVIMGSVVVSEWADQWWIWILAVVVIGSRQRALGNLAHEVSHRKLFATRVLNEHVGRLLVCWPVLIRLRSYRAAHKLHHAFLWEPRDPDLSLYLDAGTEDEAAGSWPRFVLSHVVLVVIPVVPIRLLVKDMRRSAMTSRSAAGVAVAATFVAALLAPGLARLLAFYWLVPFLTSYQAVRYWAEIGEHGGLRHLGPHGSRNWRGSAVTRWFIGSHHDDPFHAVHHAVPRVPCSGLAHMHASMMAEGPSPFVECSGFFLSTGGRDSVIRSIWRRGGDDNPLASDFRVVV